MRIKWKKMIDNVEQLNRFIRVGLTDYCYELWSPVREPTWNQMFTRPVSSEVAEAEETGRLARNSSNERPRRLDAALRAPVGSGRLLRSSPRVRGSEAEA